jgi:hypothetical protein
MELLSKEIVINEMVSLDESSILLGQFRRNSEEIQKASMSNF